MTFAERVVTFLKSQHPWPEIPVNFSPDQVRKAIEEVEMIDSGHVLAVSKTVAP